VTVDGKATQLRDLVGRLGVELRQRLGLRPLDVAEAATARRALPSDAEAARAFAEAFELARRYELPRAAARMGDAITREPDYAPYHAFLSSVLRDLSQPARADAEAGQARALAAQLPRRMRQRIEVKYQMARGEWSIVLPLLQDLRAEFPENVEYTLDLFLTLSNLGRSHEIAPIIAELGRAPGPAASDTRIDLWAAWAAGDLDQHELALSAAVVARDHAEARGQPLVAADAELVICDEETFAGRFDRAIAACESASRRLVAAGTRGGGGLARAGVGMGHRGAGR